MKSLKSLNYCLSDQVYLWWNITAERQQYWQVGLTPESNSILKCILVVVQIWYKKKCLTLFVLKNIVPKKMKQKYVGLEIFKGIKCSHKIEFVPNNFGSTKIWVHKIVLVQKIFESKCLFIQNIIRSKKHFVSKDRGSKK